MAKRKRDYYEVLGVARDADDAELKRAYREQARKYHPDINPDVAGEERIKQVNEAYNVLSNPRTRARYDRHGHAGVQADGDQGSGFGAVVDAFDDIIGDLLRRRRKRKRGRDLRYTLEVTFEEAALGCEKTIRVPRGEGAAARTFTVTIPAATKSGAVKRIRGEGEPGVDGGGTGDLNVIVRVVTHPLFTREGHDVRCEIPVSFPQAALGAVIDVPTLDGPVKMRIPEGTQSGRVFRMRGKGVPRGATASGKSPGGPRGDQLVTIAVETPTGLSARQRELLEQFAAEADAGEAVAHPRKQGFLDTLRSLFGS